MKNISLALNAALILAVGFLYYKQFSSGKTDSASSETTHTTKAAAYIPLPSASSLLPQNTNVVFVNADSVFTHYEYAKSAKVAGESRVAGYEKNYRQKMESFQKEYNDYMEKAGAGQYTKEQGLAIETALMKKRDDLMTLEQNQEKVLGEVDKTNLDVQKKVYDYLERFNKENGYNCVLAYTRSGGGVLGINESLDVTNKVLKGLNAEHLANKGK